MSYVESNLLPGEHVIRLAKIHWFIFVPGTFLVLCGIWITFGATEAIGHFMTITKRGKINE